MKGKKSFLIYLDWENLLGAMSKEQIGELFLAAFAYNNNGVVPEFEDKLLSGVFAYMKSRFDDDKEKYEQVCKRNSEHAKKRWENEKNAVEAGRKIDRISSDENRSVVEDAGVAPQNVFKNVSGFPAVRRLEE